MASLLVRRALVPASLLAIIAAATPFARAETPDEILRGPHPFLKENTLAISAGLSAASGDAVSGVRVQLAYGYELIGSLWLDLHAAAIDGSDVPVDQNPCSRCGTSAEVMGGVSYRLRMNVPVIPYAKVSVGLLYAFPDQGVGAMGLGVRPVLGARYYLYEWLGFGVEIGATLGFVNHDDVSGLSNGIGTMDVSLGAEYQF